ncbi:MAG TPA: redoxin domain-containing protein [Bryobacteraceae bacterium]|jgi:hypothetical protein
MFLSTFLTVALLANIHIPDVNGHPLDPLNPTGPASVLFFITNDCPIANSYAPEIQRICNDYAGKGVACTLVYSDLTLDAGAIRKHHSEYGYPDSIPAVKDNGHKLADATGATITPQAVVVGKGGKVLYRGRIDNFYAALGKPRRMATEHDLRLALDEVLAGKSVTHPQTQALGCYIPR